MIETTKLGLAPFDAAVGGVYFNMPTVVRGRRGCGKTVLAAHDETATLVFDEIDANVGGEIGRVVGEKMRRVAARRQVIAITHLPQSAVYGARHLVVSKAVAHGRTRTTVEAVAGAARVKEIARMLGGEQLTSVVRQHAAELLELAN